MKPNMEVLTAFTFELLVILVCSSQRFANVELASFLACQCEYFTNLLQRHGEGAVFTQISPENPIFSPSKMDTCLLKKIGGKTEHSGTHTLNTHDEVDSDGMKEMGARACSVLR